MNQATKTALMMSLKYVLPPLLASVGTAAALAYPEGYQAFCGGASWTL